MKVLSAALVLLAATLLLAGCTQENPTAKTKAAMLVGNAASIGPADAKIIMVEFSDFQCPACAATYANAKKILEDYTGQIRFVYRHYPIDSSCNENVVENLHPQACFAAQAAECARDQNKFWEFHDLLFNETIRAYETNTEPAMAEFHMQMRAYDLHLNTAQFSACLSSSQKLSNIQEDINAAMNASIEMLPTFYINNEKVQGAATYEKLKNAVQAALNKTK